MTFFIIFVMFKNLFYCFSSKDIIYTDKLLQKFTPNCLAEIMNYHTINFPIVNLPVIQSKVISEPKNFSTYTSDLRWKSKGWNCVLIIFLFDKVPDVAPEVKPLSLNAPNTRAIPYFDKNPTYVTCILLQHQTQNNEALQRLTTEFVKLLASDRFKNYNTELFIVSSKIEPNIDLPTVTDVAYVCRFCEQCVLYTTINVNPSHLIIHENSNRLSSVIKQLHGFKSPIIISPIGGPKGWARGSIQFQLPPVSNPLHFAPIMRKANLPYGFDYCYREIVPLVFRNATFILENRLEDYNKQCASKKGQVSTDSNSHFLLHNLLPKYQLAAVFATDYFTFLSCTREHQFSGVFSFHGFLSAFDPVVWWFIVLFYMLIFCASYKILVKLNIIYRQPFNFVTFGLCVLLEQDVKAIQGPPRTAMVRVLFLAPLMLMAICLSESYRGENINQLTAPNKPVPFEYLSQLIKSNFLLYYGTKNDLQNILFLLNTTSGSLISPAREHFLRQRLNPIKNGTSVARTLMTYARRKVAYFGGSVDLSLHSRSISRMANKTRRKFVLSFGKEVLLKRWRGWELRNKVDDIDIVTRLGLLEHESGIWRKWDEMRNRRMFLKNTLDELKSLREVKDYKGDNDEADSAEPLSIESNLVALFVIVLILWALSLVIFANEMRQSMHNYFSTLRFNDTRK